MRELNLLAPKGEWQFGRLVADSLMLKGVTIHWWDYRNEGMPYNNRLARTAPTLVLRGEDLERLPHILDWLEGPRYLWFTEDLQKDGGEEFLQLLCYYDDVWMHWTNERIVDTVGNLYDHKKIRVMPILYADERIWKPMNLGHKIDVLHYGHITPRREAMLNQLKRMSSADGRDITFSHAFDESHPRLARLVNQSRLILNLHAWSDVNVEIRVAEAMLCGAMVVSEPLATGGIPDGIADPKAPLIWPVAGVDEIYRFITQMLDNYPHYAGLFRPKIYQHAIANFSYTRIANAIGPLIWSDWDADATS